MVTKGLWVPLEAKPGKEEDVARFLEGGQALVEDGHAEHGCDEPARRARASPPCTRAATADVVATPLRPMPRWR